MKTLKEFQNEAVKMLDNKGKLNLHTTSFEKALEYGHKIFGDDFDKVLPAFKKTYLVTQDDAKGAKMKRKDMPRIKTSDANRFYAQLKKDNIKVTRGKMPVIKLDPIQAEMWVDKVIKDFKKHTPKVSEKFLRNKSVFIISADNKIVDGHHRYLLSMFIDPQMPISYIKVDLPMKELIPYSRNFGDSIGNARNA